MLTNPKMGKILKYSFGAIVGFKSTIDEYFFLIYF